MMTNGLPSYIGPTWFGTWPPQHYGSCPGCGRCYHCGRGYGFAPSYPAIPWWGQTTTTTGLQMGERDIESEWKKIERLAGLRKDEEGGGGEGQK